MSGDGVSLPTTIAQMGSVAKTQARGQQAGQPVAPFSEQIEKQDDLKVQRVQETSGPEKGKVDPDSDKKDKRKKRRLRRTNKMLGQDQDDDENSDENSSEENENIGILIDMRA